MKESQVASIALPQLVLISYVGYIAFGLALGVSVLYLAGQHFPRAYVGAASNLCIYAGPVFAHFRFAQGFVAWPKLEFASLGRTIFWAFVFIVAGSIAIGMMQAQWTRILAGFDDSIAFQKLNAHFEETVRTRILGPRFYS